MGVCKYKKSTSKKKQKQKKKKGENESRLKKSTGIAKEDRRTKVRSKILHMMILGPNTLKTHFGPIILSFVTLSHGLRYVPKKLISIKYEY